MKATLLAVIGIMMALATSADEPVDTLTAGNGAATNDLAKTNLDILPVLQLQDVPLSVAIMNLARQAEINCTIDPELFAPTDANGRAMAEPSVTFHLVHVTAKETLERMLTLRNLALVEGPVSHVAHITRKGQPGNVVDASLLDMPTNQLDLDTNDIIPLIQFAEVPLDVGLESLIKISG